MIWCSQHSEYYQYSLLEVCNSVPGLHIFPFSQPIPSWQEVLLPAFTLLLRHHYLGYNLLKFQCDTVKSEHHQRYWTSRISNFWKYNYMYPRHYTWQNDNMYNVVLLCDGNCISTNYLQKVLLVLFNKHIFCLFLWCLCCSVLCGGKHNDAKSTTFHFFQQQK